MSTGSSRSTALIELGQLLRAPAKLLRAVQMAFDDPPAAIAAADLGEMDPESELVPWLVLLAGLEAARRIASIDWKESADEIIASIDAASRRGRARWTWTRGLDLDAIATRPFLERAGSELAARGTALVALDAESDAYQLVVLSPANAAKLQRLARAAGVGRLVEVLHVTRARPRPKATPAKPRARPRTRAEMYPWTNLELIAGPAKKFWGARVYPKALHVTWGRIGTAGQSQWHKGLPPRRSAALAEELIAAKLRAGYRRARWCPPDFAD